MSFTRAAEELHVTQGAVSRQIQLLEESVGQTLFERRHRAVELTAVGRRYHHEVSMALSLIRAATEDLATTTDSAPLTILATHAVSTYWLMPRLDGLRARLSGADIQVLATDTEADKIKDDFDVAIRYGSGKWPGMEAEFLGDGRVFPVCAPRYLAGRASLQPVELLNESLLHLDDERWDWMDWPLWFRELGVDGPFRRPTLQVNSYPLLIQAAIDGHGIALGWQHLTDHLIASGALVQACPSILETGRAFYAVARHDRAPHPDLMELRRWLLQAYNQV